MSIPYTSNPNYDDNKRKEFYNPQFLDYITLGYKFFPIDIVETIDLQTHIVTFKKSKINKLKTELLNIIIDKKISVNQVQIESDKIFKIYTVPILLEVIKKGYKYKIHRQMDKLN